MTVKCLSELSAVTIIYFIHPVFIVIMAIYRSLSQILPMTGTPVVATVISGVASAIAALIINLDTLIEMMSIGEYTLLNI